MSLAALASVADLLRQWWTTAVLSWKAVLFVMIATLAAAIVGKIVGLLLGHVRMSRALRALELRLGQS